MATYLSPGVYIEEVATGPKPIAGLPTSIAAVVGATERGPVLEPTRLTSWNDYLAAFGGFLDEGAGYTPETVFGFFQNGGTALWMIRADASTSSQWRIRDGAGTVSFRVDAASPGAWAAPLLGTSGLDVGVSRDVGSAQGQMYGSQIVPASIPGGGLALSAGNAVEVRVASTAGAVAGMAVAITDLGGNVTNGTLAAILTGPDRLQIVPTGTRTYQRADDPHVVAVQAGGAANTSMRLAQGSGFQAGDLMQALDPTGTSQVVSLDRVRSVGAAAELTLTQGFANPVRAQSFAERTVSVPATMTATTATGFLALPAGISYPVDPGFDNVDLRRIVSEAGLEGAWNNAQSRFEFGFQVGAGPVQVVGALRARPWRSAINLVIPTGYTDAQLRDLLAPYGFVPEGATLTLVKAGGNVDIVRNSGTTAGFTVPAGSDGTYTEARYVPDTTRPLVVLSIAAPEAGDYIDLGGGAGRQPISAVEQQSGWPANTYRLTFPAALAAAPAATAATRYALSAWQPTSFRALRFALGAALYRDGNQVQSESFTGLSLNPLHPRYYFRDGIVNGVSQLIAVRERAAGATALTSVTSLPATAEVAQSGANGALDGNQIRLGLEALERRQEPAIVACPDALLLGDELSVSSAINQMIVHCEQHRRFAVVDLPPLANDVQLLDWRLRNLDSTYAAAYGPFVRMINPRPRPTSRTVDVPPSGFVMGVYARTDNDRGVWKAPANERINGIVGVTQDYTQRRQDLLNPKSVNLIRAFPGRGTRIWGARNATDDTAWLYVPVRRTFLMLENSIDAGTQWVVFEPNDDTTWLRVRVSVENFLNQIWRAGGLAGTTPEQAYRVRVGLGVTMTETDIDLGLLIIEVAAAPVKPAEFVVFRISHKRLTE